MIFGQKQVGPAYNAVVRRYVNATNVPMLVVDYRVAPEHPDPIPLQDCYDALCWLVQNSLELGINPSVRPLYRLP